MASYTRDGKKWRVSCSIPGQKVLTAGATDTEHQAILLIQAVEWLLPDTEHGRRKVKRYEMIKEIDIARAALGLPPVNRNR